MKRSFLLLLTLLFLGTTLTGQDDYYPLVWKMAIYQKKVDGTTGVLTAGDYLVKALYKDDLGDLVLAEDYLLQIDVNSTWLQFFKVGKNQSEPVPSYLLAKIHSVCYEIYYSGILIASDMLLISAVPYAEVSGGFPGFSFTRQNPSLDLQDLLNKTEEEKPGLFGSFFNSELGTHEVSNYSLNGSYLTETIETNFNDASYATGVVGTGTPKPLVFGKPAPDKLEGYYTVCIPQLTDFNNGVVLKVADSDLPENRATDHPTAALYAENIHSSLGVGVYANATVYGVFSQARTGVLGLSIGTANGSSVWGRVPLAPAAGGFKYGVLGESQGFAGAWAAAFFGDGFYTGTWTMLSDARLKSQTRSEMHALDKIMQLRPSQYEYVQNTSYSLPKGLHHGFIAQEVESIFPELVSNISLPANLDSDTDETLSYKGINYTELIAILTAAMQELNTTIQDLTITTEKQAAEIALLKEKLNHK